MPSGKRIWSTSTLYWLNILTVESINSILRIMK
jgi:hypothetical protein